MTGPRLTNAELRYLVELLFARNLANKQGSYDDKTNRWVYPTELEKKLRRILNARKP